MGFQIQGGINMRGRCLKRVVLMSVGALLLGRAVGWAQTDAEVNAGIQFNFSTPGARSLGLGGAFLGLADDATAAFTNPAGLTVLSKPEVSIEGRSWSYSNRFVQGGRFAGTPSGQGIDTVSGLQFGTAEDETSGVSFLSFVYPGKRWAAAVYRHELANFQAEFESQGPFFDQGVNDRVFPLTAAIDLKVVNLGISGSYRVNEDFSIGLGVSSYDLEMASTTVRYNFRNTQPIDFSTATDIESIQRQEDGDSDIAISLGFRWNLNDKWGIGGVYRQGPDLEFRATNTRPSVSTDLAADQTAKFNVPDVYGLGLAFRPTDALTIAVDYDRIRYSSLTADTINIFFNPDNDSLGANQGRAAARKLTVDDANEIHLGVEYILTKMTYPLALRLGGWLDPDHKIRFEGTLDNDADRRHAARFRPGDDEIHYSVGLGVVFGTFQVDAAADFSAPVDTASLSGVFRF
jgi:long-chain fatty acid transport protein